MADDNLWSAAGAGFFQGLSSTLVPLLQDKYKSQRDLAAKRLLMQEEREARKIPLSSPLAEDFGVAPGTMMPPEEHLLILLHCQEILVD